VKYVLVLLIGLGTGYYVGYRHGVQGNPSLGERVVDKIGGKSRDRVSNDIDARMRDVDDSAKAAAKRTKGAKSNP